MLPGMAVVGHGAAGGAAHLLSRFGGDATATYSSVQDTSGNIYYCGYTSNDGTGVFGATVGKISALGAIVWTRKLTKTSSDVNAGPQGVAVDGSGNVYVCGVIDASTGFIVKYNSSGTLQWQRQITPPSGSSSSAFTGVVIDGSGNVYLSGNVSVGSNAALLGLVVKYNSSGTLQWQRQIGPTSGEGASTRLNSVALDSSGNVIAVGYSALTGVAVAVKWNSSGTLQWQRALAIDAMNDVAVDSSDNVFAVGSSGGPDSGGDNVVVKWNSSGTLQTQRRIVPVDDGYYGAVSIALDATGNAYLTYQVGHPAAYRLIKYNGALSAYAWSFDFQNAASLAVSWSTVTAAVSFQDYDGSTFTGAAIMTLSDASGPTAGTYGDVVVSSVTPTEASSSYTGTTPTLTEAAGTAVDAAGGLTSASITYSSTSVTPI